MRIDKSLTKNRLRVGAVSYLNTKPLVYRLTERLPEAEIVLDYPSRLADALVAEKLDIALIPSVELLAHPDWSVVSDACIACRGPVLSVKLLFRVPPAKVQTLALDEGSRTSAVLAQILLHELHGAHPQLASLPLGAEARDVSSDAVLIIGDRAIRSETSDFVEIWDLGDRWCRWSELPFVFAMWVARPGVDTSAASEALTAARDEGCRNLASISRQQSIPMKLSYELVFEYLSQNLHFTMGNREKRGLDLFFQRALACRLVPDSMDSVHVG